MKKKARIKIPAHINKLFDNFADVFDVKNLDKHISFPLKDKEGIAADIDVDEDYQRAHVSIYPSFFTYSRRVQREYLLHEYCHIVSHPLVHLLDEFKRGHHVTPHQIKAECERTTSRISNILDGFLTGRFHKEIRGYREYSRAPKKSKPKKTRK